MPTKLLLYSLTGFLVFTWGLLVGKYELFPYGVIRATYHRLGTLGGESPPDATKVGASRSSPPQSVNQRTVLSSLLPLTVERIDVREPTGLVPVGGAIATVDSRVLISGQTGHLFVYDTATRSFLSHTLPPISSTPTRRMAPASPARILVHDIEFTADGTTLVASYEQRRPDTGTTELVVSALSIDSVDMTTPAGGWRFVFGTPAVSVGSGEGLVVAAGGSILPTDASTVLLAVGDFGQDGVANGDGSTQDQPSVLGSILELDVNTGAVTAVTEGHRNPQGLARTRSGDVFSTEHGPSSPW